MEGCNSNVRSQILGPHFEELARTWVRLFADESTLGGPIGEVGFTVIPDREQRTNHEIDIVALQAGERRHKKSSAIACIGEAKASNSFRNTQDLERLERIRALLVADGAPCADATLLLFGRSGFDDELQAVAEERRDVELVDQNRVYSGS